RLSHRAAALAPYSDDSLSEAISGPKKTVFEGRASKFYPTHDPVNSASAPPVSLVITLLANRIAVILPIRIVIIRGRVY
ncbi:MAG: hypothetical protein OEU26_31375, partial [Candidatus Tectomicrobia bacterium]|nr:hypothetical protein [Candidatus Tectomicrobia bacterium]